MNFTRNCRVSVILVTLLAIIGLSRHSSTANVRSGSLKTANNQPVDQPAPYENVEESNSIELQRPQDSGVSNSIDALSNTLIRDRRTHPRIFRGLPRNLAQGRVHSRPRSTIPPSLADSTEKWTVEIIGGPQEADRIASLHDCKNLGLVKGFHDIYLFEKRVRREDENLQRDKRFYREATIYALKSHQNVVWVEPQTTLTRVKRSFMNVYQQRFLPIEQMQYFQPSGPTITHVMNYGSQTQSQPQQQQTQQKQQQYHSVRPIQQESLIRPHPPQFTYSQILQSQPKQAPTMIHQQVQQQYHPSSERKLSNKMPSPNSVSAPSVLQHGSLEPPTFKDAHNKQFFGVQINPSEMSQVVAPLPIDKMNPTLTNSSTTSPNDGLVGSTKQISNHNIGNDAYSRGYSSSVSNDDKYKYDDELWMHQWYLQDNSNNAHIRSGMHLHVQDVWKMGYTGKNVVVSVIDDGLEWNHTDLINNYDPRASYDMNNNDSDPFPRYDPFETNSHGTRCAGEIAMVSNNKKCGVGVAPDAKIGGIKSLDGDVSDHIESMSLLHNLDYIDIYSGSWGPKDDGMTLEGPKRLATQALKTGVSIGRKGRGAIYVWANGNGGVSGDNCNCDGYVSSIYTLAVGSVTQMGEFPFYGERCASTLAVTCSSGTQSDKKVTTTDLHNKCTTDYSGTSAAAPLAAGIMALVLEANPNITWRDAQHLVAWTSDYFPLKDNIGWFRNAAGLMFNNKFGFGLMNAKSLVDAALRWENVGPKSICYIYAEDRLLPDHIVTGVDIEFPFYTDGCDPRYIEKFREKSRPGDKYDPPAKRPATGIYVNERGQPVNYMEHVELTLTIEYTVRGDLDIFLTSPRGTTSHILTHRPMDKSVMGFQDWTFMSVHFWGEQPHGLWILRIRDKNRAPKLRNMGFMINATLILHGTTIIPKHMQKGNRIYDDEDQISDTLAKTETTTNGGGFTLFDENPWDQNNYPNEMSQVTSEVDEQRLVTARMVDSSNIASLQR